MQPATTLSPSEFWCVLGMDTFHSYFFEWWPNCCRICSFRENANIKLLNKYILKGSIPWVCCQDSPVSFKDFSKIIKSFSLRTTWHKRLEQLPQRSESLHKLDGKNAISTSKSCIPNQISLEFRQFMAHENWLPCFSPGQFAPTAEPLASLQLGLPARCDSRTKQPIHTLYMIFCGERPWNSILAWICWTSCQMNSKTTCFSSLSLSHTHLKRNHVHDFWILNTRKSIPNCITSPSLFMTFQKSSPLPVQPPPGLPLLPLHDTRVSLCFAQNGPLSYKPASVWREQRIENMDFYRNI